MSLCQKKDKPYNNTVPEMLGHRFQPKWIQCEMMVDYQLIKILEKETAIRLIGKNF